LGKLKWTPYEYYTSSPCEFYYACKGYFDEREEQILLMRNVAMFASGNGVHKDFDKAWPVKNSGKKEITRVTVSEDMKQTIARLHGVQI
jgi:hypothetical protein